MSRKGNPPQNPAKNKMNAEQELDRWEQFWFSPIAYRRLRLLRVGLGMMVLLVVANFWGNIDRWFSGTGLMSTSRLARIVMTAEVTEAARWRLSVINYLESPLALHGFLAIIAICGIGLTLGVGGRWTALGCWVGMLSLANSLWVVADAGWVVFCFSLLTIVIAGAGDRPLWKRIEEPLEPKSSWNQLAIRLTQVHFIGFLITYGISNLNTAWPTGDGLQICLSLSSFAVVLGLAITGRNRIFLIGMLMLFLSIVGWVSGDFMLSISLALMSTVYIDPWSRASTTN